MGASPRGVVARVRGSRPSAAPLWRSSPNRPRPSTRRSCQQTLDSSGHSAATSRPPPLTANEVTAA
jgi:hypothetical protein